jgi:clan AA aspartic protease (TIGR02281 family)
VDRVAARLRIAALACILALAPVRGGAEVYVWTDAEGRVQMTEDLSRVPPEQRARALQEGEARSRRAAAAAAEKAAAAKESGEGVAPAPRPEARPAKPAKKKKAQRSAGRKHVLRVERAGSEMRVNAVVDGVTVPFILDTGASICTLPSWAAVEMGVEIDENTSFIGVTGVSGQMQMVPDLQVRSVTVGDAEVHDLHMAVMPTMDVGLLGMPFFNHFKVSTDPARGILVLEEIDLNALSGVAGGLSENTWRQRFQAKRRSLEIARAKLERVPYEYITQREKLEKQVAYWENQLEQLETEATRAGVPQEWRE